MKSLQRLLKSFVTGSLQHVVNPADDALLGSIRVKKEKKKDTSITGTDTDISDIVPPLAEELGQILHQSADNVPVC